AGLIVIDYIDMVENRSNRAVERRLKDALKDDRARIQVGRISHFGLMEMSRQRIRFGVVESSTHKCPICDGTGLVRSVESLALMIMRHIEDHVLRRQGQSINVRIPVEVALYILNFKRETLTALEIRNQLSITITADGKMTGNQFAIEKGEARVLAFADQQAVSHVRVDSSSIDDSVDDDFVEEDEEEQDDKPVASSVTSTPETGDEEGGEPSRRRRRRRRRGGERGDDNGGPRPAQQRPPQSVQAAAPVGADLEGNESDEDGEEEENSARPTDADAATAEGERKRRRRGRRGGRRNRRDELEGGEKAPSPAGETGLSPVQAEAVAEVLLAQDEIVAEQPAVAAAPVAAEKPKRARRKKIEETAESAPAETEPVEAVATEAAPTAEEKPKRKPRAPRKAKAEASEAAAVETVTAPVAQAAVVEAPARVDAAPVAEAEKPKRARKELPPEGIVVSSTVAKPETAVDEAAEPDKKKKGGWWQRRLGLG
ncbi:MAG: ribonuclease E/G, partial [Devosia sp.]